MLGNGVRRQARIALLQASKRVTLTSSTRRSVSVSMQALSTTPARQFPEVQSARENSPSRQLFIGNIPNIALEADIRDAFEKFGDVEQIRLTVDSNNTLRRIGFVEFKQKDAAEAALAAPITLFGRPLRLAYSARPPLDPHSTTAQQAKTAVTHPPSAAREHYPPTRTLHFRGYDGDRQALTRSLREFKRNIQRIYFLPSQKNADQKTHGGQRTDSDTHHSTKVEHNSAKSDANSTKSALPKPATRPRSGFITFERIGQAMAALQKLRPHTITAHPTPNFKIAYASPANALRMQKESRKTQRRLKGEVEEREHPISQRLARWRLGAAGPVGSAAAARMAGYLPSRPQKPLRAAGWLPSLRERAAFKLPPAVEYVEGSPVVPSIHATTPEEDLTAARAKEG
ncbi:hypothetical protein C8R43DRAFT_1032119 [Mycena crocata]|nr:hypothetical protein C8R43DRAFT_1032119 [Mycena crocata]